LSCNAPEPFITRNSFLFQKSGLSKLRELASLDFSGTWLSVNGALLVVLIFYIMTFQKTMSCVIYLS